MLLLVVLAVLSQVAPSPLADADCASSYLSLKRLEGASTTNLFLCMATDPVTQAQWDTIIAASRAGDTPYPLGPAPSTDLDCPECPVDTVDWYEAAMFANLLSELEGRSACYALRGCSGVPWPAFSRDVKYTVGAVCNVAAAVDGCTGYRLPSEQQWLAARARMGTGVARPLPGVGNRRLRVRPLKWGDSDGREWIDERAPPSDLELELGQRPAPDNLFRRGLMRAIRGGEYERGHANPSLRAIDITFRLVRG